MASTTRISTLSAVLAGLLLCMTAAMAVADKPVQHWMQTKKSTIGANLDHPSAEIIVDNLNIKNFTADFHFDPRELKDSRVMLSASFLPVKLPGNRDIDEDAQRMAAGLFESDAITQTGDTTFTVRGQFKMNARQQQVIFPMQVAYGGKTDGVDTLVFSGTMQAPVGQMSPMLGLPKYVPVAFSVHAVPAP